MSESVTTTIERKCSLADLFEPGFIELLRLVPNNPLVRALLLKFTGQRPGPECVTFDQLQEWIELNCKKRPSPTGQRRGANAPGGIVINVEFSESEYGRADYTVTRSGSDTFRVEAAELLELVQEAIAAGGGLDEVVDLVAGKIEDDAWRQCEPNLDNYGDYSYDDHDTTGSDDSETEYSKDEIRNAVRAFVRERHPELAAEL